MNYHYNNMNKRVIFNQKKKKYRMRKQDSTAQYDGGKWK